MTDAMAEFRRARSRIQSQRDQARQREWPDAAPLKRPEGTDEELRQVDDGHLL